MMAWTLADIGSVRGLQDPQAGSLADLDNWAMARPGADLGEIAYAYAPHRRPADESPHQRDPTGLLSEGADRFRAPVRLAGDPTPKIVRPWESGGAGGAGPGWTVAPPGGPIFRRGTRSPSNLTPRPGEEGLSFRDSLSNPYPKGDQPVFRPGDKYIAVDPSRLPPDSVIRDNVPPGHVTVSPSPIELLLNAIIGGGRLPK